MDCTDMEELQDEDPFVFKSSSLRTLSGTLTAKAEGILRNQIIKPIFASCQNLQIVELHLNTSLSSEFLITLLSKESLVEVDLSATASPYTFQDFALLSKGLPNVKRLRLPWPSSIGIPTNDEEGTVMDWRNERDGSQDLPERLSFEQCQLLAAKLTKLNEIVFDINTEPLAHTYQTWSGPLDYAISFDPSIVDEDIVRHDESFKMATFIDERSPCLNVCSVFVNSFSGGDDASDADADSQMSMSLLLSLNQVRRHTTVR